MNTPGSSADDTTLQTDNKRGLTANNSKKDQNTKRVLPLWKQKQMLQFFRAVITTYFTVRCKFEEKKGTYEKKLTANVTTTDHSS